VELYDWTADEEHIRCPFCGLTRHAEWWYENAEEKDDAVTAEPIQ
jgi:hypothetical protein